MDTPSSTSSASGNRATLCSSLSRVAFTAAMLAHPPRAPGPPGPPGAEQRFWRPDPLRRALVPFDPWAAPPLLDAAVLLGAKHAGTNTAKGRLAVATESSCES